MSCRCSYWRSSSQKRPKDRMQWSTGRIRTGVPLGPVSVPAQEASGLRGLSSCRQRAALSLEVRAQLFFKKTVGNFMQVMRLRYPTSSPAPVPCLSDGANSCMTHTGNCCHGVPPCSCLALTPLVDCGLPPTYLSSLVPLLTRKAHPSHRPRPQPAAAAAAGPPAVRPHGRQGVRRLRAPQPQGGRDATARDAGTEARACSHPAEITHARSCMRPNSAVCRSCLRRLTR